MPTALITGGTRGLGRALATALAKRNWRVVVDGRNEAAIESLAAAVDGEVVGVVGDVTDPVHRTALVDTVGGRLDLLVNNASELGSSPLPALSEIPSDAVARVFEVNVHAPLALIQGLLPSLAVSSGVVVNVSSDAAVEAYEGWGAYGASKAALDQLSAVLAVENPTLSIYAFDPGDMRTDMHQAAFPGEDISDRPLPETVVPALLRLVESRPASGRIRATDLLAEVS